VLRPCIILPAPRSLLRARSPSCKLLAVRLTIALVGTASRSVHAISPFAPVCLHGLALGDTRETHRASPMPLRMPLSLALTGIVHWRITEHPCLVGAKSPSSCSPSVMRRLAGACTSAPGSQPLEVRSGRCHARLPTLPRLRSCRAGCLSASSMPLVFGPTASPRTLARSRTRHGDCEQAMSQTLRSRAGARTTAASVFRPSSASQASRAPHSAS
jgi:hypothetical protein